MDLSVVSAKKAIEHLYKEEPVYCGLMNDKTTLQELKVGNLSHEIIGYTGDRKLVTFSTVDDDGEYGFIENTSTVSFNSLPASRIKYAVFVDAPTEGEIIGWCPMKDAYGNLQDRIVQAGNTVSFSPGNLKFKLG